MLPDFIKKFESDLKKYERRFVRIKVRPLDQEPLQDKTDIASSKFLGIPFYPSKNKYPLDKNGKPMIMIAQLNFEQIPRLDLFPESGILQLFISSTDWYNEDSIVLYHSNETLNEQRLTDFSFLSIQDYEEIPIHKIHELSFELAIDKGGSEDVQFDYLFDGVEYWEYIERLSEDHQKQINDYFDATGHKIGGYAEFTQSDPREYSLGQIDDFHLLQIDVDDHIMFGDSGLGHVFISKENLIRKDFDKAYFYWDCC